MFFARTLCQYIYKVKVFLGFVTSFLFFIRTFATTVFYYVSGINNINYD